MTRGGKRWCKHYVPAVDPTHVHLHPLDDLMLHDLTGDDCVCGPTPQPVLDGPNGDMWVLRHHSLDGREIRRPS